MRGKYDRIGKRKKKYQAKIDGKFDIIPLFLLLGVNHCQPILHISKIFVCLYTKYEHINPFSIGYIINPTLHVDKVFIEQVEK